MNIVKKIWGFIAKHFSKQVWRERWLDIRAFPRKRVNAQTLMGICESINPSYDHLVAYVRRELGSTYGFGRGDCLDNRNLADIFYDERDRFLNREFLNSTLRISIPDSVYENLIKNFSSAKEGENFRSKVAAAGLQKHVLLSDNHGRNIIEFRKIMVEGDVNLNLGEKFYHWWFYRVKFCDNARINIYPPSFTHRVGEMIFAKSICLGDFSCWFAGVPHFDICDSKFMSFVTMEIGTDTQFSSYGRVDKMMKDFLEISQIPTINFSSNRFEKHLQIFSGGVGYRQTVDNPTLGEVRFFKGNYIDTLYLSPAFSLEIKPVEVKAENPVNPHKEGVKVNDIHFDAHERIKIPLNRHEMLRYKNFFINLKNRAIERRDREAEFGYARKERYFDRGLANRWQDKFILGWSHYVSDSGISWIRPIGWLIAVQVVLAAAFIGWNVWICPSDWSVGGWAKTVIESFDPLSKVESKCADSISAPLYNVARKIFLFLFLYEIIKVFRRFSK